MGQSRLVWTSSHREVGGQSRNRQFVLPLLSIVLFLLVATRAPAQGVCDTKQKGTIACLLPNAVDSSIRTLAPNFNIDPAFPTGDAVLVVPLASSLPIPSPASGFVYALDNSTGAYIRSSQTFGPILAERAETIGRNKVFVGITFQRFVFDKVDGINLHDITTVTPNGDGTTTNHFNVGLELNQFTVFATYGIADRVDVSLAVPISTVYAGVTFSGAIRTSATGFQPVQTPVVSVRQTASGFGDVNLQLKGTLIRSEHAALAFGANLRLPTGDEYQALGAGAPGIEPFLVASTTYKRATPHLNIGYRRNGQSILSGNILTGVKSHIPSQVTFAAGADIGITKRLTVALDALGFEVIHGSRLTLNANANVQGGLVQRSYNIANGSAGFKLNLVSNLLFVANVLFPLNDGGLRSKVVPLIGLSYGF